MRHQSVGKNIDWITVLIYILLVLIGWANIYSADVTPDSNYIFDITQNYGKQLIFISFTILVIIVVLSIEAKFYERFSSVLYGISLLTLIGLFVAGKTIAGQRCWYAIGSFTLQPSEFAKSTTALALAKFLSDSQINLKNFNHQLLGLSILFIPVGLIMLQPDAGSALIFITMIFVLNREGLPSWYLWTGVGAIVLFIMSLLLKPQYVVLIALTGVILHFYKSKPVKRNIVASSIVFLLMSGFSISVNYVFENVFQQHHRDRFNILLGKEVDLAGIGYNTNQSEIAIGSGGLLGKGWLEGTQTKGNFVPEQHTDYIFTTVGEEWGFIGSTIVVLLFAGLLLRILYLAENQRTKFSRIYGYGVASILFTHYFVNIAMVIGIFPTIGVPLPFLSYGGSSLWAFTILLFVFLKMDANKVNEW
ncbi:rod shape-determining protein RodA [Flavobacterium columnare NBRC 100251 = ATCC 23463]|uniref:Cell wall polymerase n=1 Tax=Flavobacterium columnare (strain ATCC 49512 / CIP 103533 / TG 44/87) TaxID=1041826 RepID=G8X6T5_FLACA|nr:rod shape-determining protein RodA [Flavobacterium columnare]AEW85670.1 rod shape-determining protein RodA [Flavobacterium columnare ATCC 49512]ANO47394.1 rod shape-determining protein RodA [Flavobacterium columnare]APT21954.1 rod shape-determining protein RodA [Flavobacterium columnare]MBF6652060.1 rod shape-determining protein RodA [Flavobacterium columnare]MBF6655940.1 rod shape-determining protein RodA [Flavobacterium columnare]